MIKPLFSTANIKIINYGCGAPYSMYKLYYFKSGANIFINNHKTIDY